MQYRKSAGKDFIDIVVDSTGLKVYGNGEWHARKHRATKRRTWPKLHLAVDATSHDIVGAELSMVNVSEGEALADLIRPLRRNSDRVTGDGAYDTRSCYEEVAAKGAIMRVPPREYPKLGRRTPQKQCRIYDAPNRVNAVESEFRVPSSFTCRDSDVSF